MAKQTTTKSRGQNPEQRHTRRQQVLFTIMAVILILSWVLTLIVQI